MNGRGTLAPELEREDLPHATCARKSISVEVVGKNVVAKASDFNKSQERSREACNRFNTIT
jgi:hypothetical protein